MTNQEILRLLQEIDDGCNPTEEEVRLLTSIKTITWNSIDNIPESIHLLTGLKKLDVSGNHEISRLKKIPAGIENLNSLTELNLSFTMIRELPESIDKLTSLEWLYLNGTQLRELPKGVDKMANLVGLYLNNTPLKELPESIKNLEKLSFLYLRNTLLSKLPDSIGYLTCLRHIDLSSTHLDELPESIGRLTRLKWLSLNNTRLSKLPESMGDLIELRGLYLRNTPLSELPDTVGNLKSLLYLDLSQTYLRNLPENIADLSNLKNLDLSSSHLRELPESIGELSGIKTLSLENLTMSELPESLLNLKHNFTNNKYKSWDDYPGIYTRGLKLENQPIEIFSKSRELIIEYYKTSKIKKPINECKVVFLGDGGAGKSLMINRLTHDGEISNDFNGESTPGISISSQKYGIGDDEIELHFWDFGGQAILHSMHRLFLTNRTLYVVVTNARDNKANEQAWYWIRNITSFANNAPILLFVNHKDQNPSVTVNENGLKKDYPQLKCIKIVSALKDTKTEFEALVRDTICQIVSRMDTVHTMFASSWLSLMNELQEMPENYISSSEFCERCGMYGIGTKKELIDEIINWYQDLGVCFYSHKHPVTGQYMVLKPRWLLNALYILVFNGRKHSVNGIIKEKEIYNLLCPEKENQDTKKVWDDIIYKPQEIQYVINVLLNFDLIYEMVGLEEKHFFIPMLCDENEPMMDAFDSEDVRHVSFEYQYLPDNVLHRLMVRLGNELNTEVVWKTGAEFRRKRCGWVALVRIKDNCLDVYAKSDRQEIHPINTYLDLMRESIYEINKEFGLDFDEYIIYYRDGKSDRFDYEELQGSLISGLHEIYSKKIHARLNIEEILGIIKSPEEMFQLGTDSQLIQLPDDMFNALHSLQGNSDYYGAHENRCNTYVRDLLRMRGYVCEDQTFHGLSETGNSSGSLDILIRDKDNKRNLSIYEALWLKSFGKADRKYLDKHISKLLDNYNADGLTCLFLVAYVTWDKIIFNEFARQYCQYVMTDSDVPFGIMDSMQIDIVNDTFMRCMRVRYNCGGTSMYVYHIVMRLSDNR